MIQSAYSVHSAISTDFIMAPISNNAEHYSIIARDKISILQILNMHLEYWMVLETALLQYVQACIVSIWLLCWYIYNRCGDYIPQFVVKRDQLFYSAW